MQATSGLMMKQPFFVALLLTVLTVGSNRMANAADGGADNGAAIYEHHCTGCHERGNGHPGTQSLGYLYGKEKAALADRDNLTPEYVRLLVRHGRGLMPAFRPAEISDAELKILTEYLATGPHPAARSR